MKQIYEALEPSVREIEKNFEKQGVKMPKRVYSYTNWDERQKNWDRIKFYAFIFIIGFNSITPVLKWEWVWFIPPWLSLLVLINSGIGFIGLIYWVYRAATQSRRERKEAERKQIVEEVMEI